MYQSYDCIFFLIEGDLTEGELGVSYAALWSALLNAELRRTSHVVRTADVKETAAVVRLLVQKGGVSPKIPSGIAPQPVLTKRKRDAEPDLVFMRQLMIIPSISENVARKLLDQFGNLPELQKALQEKKKFPKIELDQKRSLGKARIDKLASFLL